MTNAYIYHNLITTPIITFLIIYLCQQEVLSSFIAIKPKNCNTFTGKHSLRPICLSTANNAESSTPLQSIEENISNANEVDLEMLEHVADDVFVEDERPIILFDGVCNLCNSAVNFALDYDSVGNFRFASLQSKIGQSLLIKSGKKFDDMSSIVLVTPSKTYFKTDAVVRILKGLDSTTMKVGATVAGILPSFLRNGIYDIVGANRYIFGERDMCRIDDGEFEDRFVSDP